MSKKHDRNNRQHAMLGAALLMLSVPLAPHLHAQSADVFIRENNASGSDGSDPSANNVPAEPVDERPSRFAGEDITKYTASRAAVFSMRNRTTDPFGLNQDPNVKPPERKLADNKPVKRQAALPPTPLKEIVKLIRVTTIMPGEKKFLVGVRTFSESEQFPLLFNGKRMNMKVLEVSTRSILFQNLDNGDTASLETAMLPPGMIAGGGSIQPPGLVQSLANSPLELGFSNHPEAEN
ncbi:hypothetical protein HZ994_16165 [Akkermansiaceae bacterium]|nr:hypothetical protein HZ994_16165 [Akkermansiaceae bacterium]